MQVPLWNPFDWASSNWPYLVGWSALLTFLYRGYTGINKLAGLGKHITEARDGLKIIMENHLPHIQASVEAVGDKIEAVDENITGMREDIKFGLARVSDEMRIVLTRMP